VPATSPCTPSGAVKSAIVLGAGGEFSIAGDRTFAATGEGPTGITGATGTYSITMAGSFDAAGNVSGTARVKDSFTLNGTHYECDSDVVKFTGHL
jgi:hypothetical protein